MSSFVKKEIDFNDVNFGYYQKIGANIIKDETNLSPDELLVKTELLPPGEVTLEESTVEEEASQELLKGDSTTQTESVTKPEVIWFIKSEASDKEDTWKEEPDASSMEYKGILITPKLEEAPLPSCKRGSLNFQDSTVHPNLPEHSGKMQVLHDDQQMKPPSKEKLDWNLSKEEIQDCFINCQGLKVKKQSKDYVEINSKSEKALKCKYCHKKFGNRGNFQKHLCIHTGVNPFECSYCNKKLNSKRNLRNHLELHTGEKPFKCSKCNKKYSNKETLESHFRMHKAVEPFECTHCNKIFSQKGSLQRHLKIHTGEKPFECNHCHKKCFQKGDLLSHLRIHSGEKPFECSHCNKMFSQKVSLQRHLRIHTGEKPFKCSHCNKKFSEKGGLLNHLRIHTGEKPFKCSHCNHKFSLKGYLQKHLRIHTGEKPFECSQCNEKFSQKVTLKRHLKIHY